VRKLKHPRCDKCKVRLNGHQTQYVEQCVSYLFCNDCSIVYDSMPNTRIHDFVQPNFMSGRIGTDILKAKYRRARGELHEWAAGYNGGNQV
jgi:hypothetical protein